MVTWVIFADDTEDYVGKTFFIFRQFYISQVLHGINLRFKNSAKTVAAENGNILCQHFYAHLKDKHALAYSRRHKSFQKYTFHAVYESTDDDNNLVDNSDNESSL